LPATRTSSGFFTSCTVSTKGQAMAEFKKGDLVRHKSDAKQKLVVVSVVDDRVLCEWLYKGKPCSGDFDVDGLEPWVDQDPPPKIALGPGRRRQ
jgi:hypothetical protein